MEKVIITEKNILQFKGNFQDPAIIQQIKIIVQDFAQNGSVGDAYDFLKKLQSVLKGASLIPQMSEEYSGLILFLKFIAFPLLDNEEQHELLNSHLFFAIDKEIDLKDRIHLVFFPYFKSDDSQKINLFLRAIEKNSEPLAGKTIGAWVQEYNKSKKFDTGGTLSIVNFITQIKDSSPQLDEKAKEKLRLILLLFDWIRYSAVPKEFLTGQKFEISQVAKTLKPPLSLRKGPVQVTPKIKLMDQTINASEAKENFDQRLGQGRTPLTPPKPQPLARPESPPKSLGSFEQRLAQVNTLPAEHGQRLEELKHRIEEQKIDNRQQGAQKAVSPVVPVPPVMPNADLETRPLNSRFPPDRNDFVVRAGRGNDKINQPRMTQQEIKREVEMVELPGHGTGNMEQVSVPPASGNQRRNPELNSGLRKAPVPPVMPDVRPLNSRLPASPAGGRGNDPMGLGSLNDVKTLDDLKKVTVANLRQAPFQQQIFNLKSLILNLSKANRVLPYYVVVAFEQSPLFQAYLSMGSAKVAGQESRADLTQQEFEAIADLRKEIERL